MRDYSTAGKRRRAGTMGRYGTIDPEPLPAPPGPQEHRSNVELMAYCLFGCPVDALGLTEVTLDDV